MIRPRRAWFAPLGLRAKLMLIITVPLVVIVALVVLILGMIQVDQAKETIIDHAESLIQAMNQSLERVYLSQDQRQTADVIDWLRSFPDIRQVYAYNRQGEIFFGYAATGDEVRPAVVPDPPNTRFFESRLALSRPFVSGEHEVGVVYLETSATRLMGQIRDTLITLGAISATVLALGLMIAVALQRTFSRPILELQQVAEQVSTHEDFNVRAVKRTHDEIGRLVDAFNSMLSRIQTSDDALREANRDLEQRVQIRTFEIASTVNRLEDEIQEHQKTQAEREVLYRDLMTASRQAGMAEVATGILHNVGNVLNSVNVSAGVLMDKIRQSQAGSLAKVCQLLDQNAARLAEFFEHDAKGTQLREYLKMLAERLVAERDEAVRELRCLADNIEHIKEIVNLQQSLSRACALREPVSLPELMENAVKINNAGLHRHGVELIREYEDVPAVVTEKHKVLQILVNFISNAKYAASAAERPDRKIWLRIHCQEDDRVAVDVVDNGIGIAPDHLTRVFTRGFTTREGGHGFGLHSSALAAKEMGGQVSVMSDGRGQGATFRLELPLVFNDERGDSVVLVAMPAGDELSLPPMVSAEH